MMLLTEEQKKVLRKVKDQKGVGWAFMTEEFKIAVGLAADGLLHQSKTISPWHDRFHITRKGSRALKLGHVE